MHFFMVYLMVYYWDLGFLGICIASSVHFLIRYVIALTIITYSEKLKNDFDNPVKLVSEETV